MTNADLIAQTRQAIDAEPAGEWVDVALQLSRLKSLADALCVELEDAIDPDGKGRRLLARMDALNAKLDALAARAGVPA